MFITTKYSGLNRHGQQSAAGLFLILMQPQCDAVSKYPFHSDRCRVCGKTQPEHRAEHVPACPEHGIVARLRAIGDAKRYSDTALVDELLASEKYHHGCAACEAHKADSAMCHWFAPASIPYPLRGIVRYVRMRQLGHFMMGSARVGKTRISLSGSYGSDGLPCSVPDEAYEAGTPLPQALYDAWNKGGGWNSAGSEADIMRMWAIENLISNRNVKAALEQNLISGRKS